MTEFNILNHLDKLEPDGGTNNPRGDHSYHCPVCGSNNFKVHVTTGKWTTFGCDCSNTEAGKRKIRNALSPAKAQNSIAPATKSLRPKAKRQWIYCNADGTKVLQVNRTDDGDGKRKFWQKSLINGQESSEVGATVRPYGYAEAIQALDDGESFVLWVEGESCVDAVRLLGLAAVTSLGGSGKFNPDRDGGLFPADRLVVVPDRDQPGIKHADDIAAAYPGCHWLCPFPGTAEWNGCCPPNGGLDIADWIEEGATAEQIISTIGPRPDHLHRDEAGPELPDLRDEFLRDAEGLKSRLDRGLQKIDELPDVASRAVALHTLQKDLELNQKAFSTLVNTLAESRGPQTAESFEELMAAPEEMLQPLVEDLLPTGLVMIAAEGFAGKSNTLYQICEAVTNGSKFAGQFQAQQGAALIIQKDESPTDARRKWRTMGLNPAKGRFTVKWKFSPMMIPELRHWVQETGARIVGMDSLLTCAGGEISPKDPEFGLLIYRLNQLAAELNITILCLHHLTKALSGKARTEVSKDDIFGTTYVFNGSSDVWGLWNAAEEGNPEKVFFLRNLKCRSGLVDGGVTYEFNGCEEDNRLTFRGITGRTTTLNERRNAKDRIVALLKAQVGNPLSPPKISERLQLGNRNYCSRLCLELFNDPRIAVGRKKGPTGGGRTPYLYFWQD